jgi:hypothetical protein
MTDTRYLIVEIDDSMRKTHAYVDYGQDDPERRWLLTDEKGEKMLFNAPAAVLNYPDRRGWEMNEMFILPGGGSESSSVYGERFFIFQHKQARI